MVPLLETRLQQHDAAQQPQAGLQQALELYMTLLLHVHCAQFPGEAGAGKAPEGMGEVLALVERFAPNVTAESAQVARIFWDKSTNTDAFTGTKVQILTHLAAQRGVAASEVLWHDAASSVLLVCADRYSGYVRYWYKRTNTDAEGSAAVR